MPDALRGQAFAYNSTERAQFLLDGPFGFMRTNAQGQSNVDAFLLLLATGQVATVMQLWQMAPDEVRQGSTCLAEVLRCREWLRSSPM